MDVPFEEGVLSPSAADMRPGERNHCSFPHGTLRADAAIVRGQLPMHSTHNVSD